LKAKNILFPTDLSETSQTALSYASALASESGATLHIVYVDEVPEAFVEGLGPGGAGYGYVPDPENTHKGVHNQLLAVRPTIDGVKYEHHFLRGHPDEAILQFSDSEDIDLIVMGSHGRKGITRLLMGSVAESVVRRAKCPVLTVKEPSHPEDAEGAEDS